MDRPRWWVRCLSLPLAAICMVGELHSQDRREPFNPGPTGSPGVMGGRPGPSAGRIQPSQNSRPRQNLTPLPGQPRVPDTDIDRDQPDPIANRERLLGPEGVLNPYRGMKGGITLDECIESMVSGNLDLQQSRGDITHAEADLITAGLRTNPIAYVDTQNVPYGKYTDRTTGGPVQYDFNIVYPLDFSRKRQARVRSAQFSKQAAEAKYEDTVRLGIDNLYTAYVDALVAQRNKEYKEYKEYRDNEENTAEKKDKKKDAEKNPGLMTREPDEVQDTYDTAFARLAILLNVSREELKGRGLRGRIAYNRNEEPVLPSEEELVQEALACRPDLIAQKIGVSRADADIEVAKTSRFDDAQLLLQPYTLYRGIPPSAPSDSYGWSVGLTIPLPIYNRQQGNILKAETISHQSRLQTQSIENNIEAEVRQAYRQRNLARAAVEKFIRENHSNREAKNQSIDRLKARFGEKGKDRDEDLLFLVTRVEKVLADSEEEELKKFDELLVQSRRAMLRLNTAVGRRILP